MENFNLKGYLAENKLLKELEVSDVNVKNDAENIMKEFIQAVEKASNSEEIFEKFENWVNSFMPGAIKEDLRKYLAENKLLKEINYKNPDTVMENMEDYLEQVYEEGEKGHMDDMMNTFKALSELASQYMKKM